MKALRARMEPKHAGTCAIEVGHREHLSADVAIAHPINQVMSPVDRLPRVRQRQAKRANALVVHGCLV